jgi:hypothetical protein
LLALKVELPVTAAQSELVTPVLQVVQGAVTRHLLDAAELKADEGHGGAVTLIQRFGAAANLNVQLRCLVLDGVYRRGADGEPVFVEVPPPTDEGVQAVLHRIVQKVLTVQGTMARETGFKQDLCADINGFSLHAAGRCGSEERQRWSNFAATSRARRWPTNGCSATPPGRWSSSSRRRGATAPRTWS